MNDYKRLNERVWRTCVDSMPIFGIDMVIFSRATGILMGNRINNPAKGTLFVPGGRVYKNEKMLDAFHRILLNETGIIFPFKKSTSIGLYEHFYNVTAWSSIECSTHYIVDARLIEVNTEDIKPKLNLNSQHSDYEWINLEDIDSKNIHSYSKVYINRIKDLKGFI